MDECLFANESLFQDCINRKMRKFQHFRVKSSAKLKLIVLGAL